MGGGWQGTFPDPRAGGAATFTAFGRLVAARITYNPSSWPVRSRSRRLLILRTSIARGDQTETKVWLLMWPRSRSVDRRGHFAFHVQSLSMKLAACPLAAPKPRVGRTSSAKSIRGRCGQTCKRLTDVGRATRVLGAVLAHAVQVSHKLAACLPYTKSSGWAALPCVTTQLFFFGTNLVHLCWVSAPCVHA